MCGRPVRREFSKDVRAMAFTRAKDRCERCGSRNELELHHIGDHGDASLFNSMVLCCICHAAEHLMRKKKRLGGRP